MFLCAGKGTRMRPISYSVPKHLIPIANKRILRYNVEKVIDAGIDEIGLVVSPEMEGMYRDVLGNSRWGASITYIHQEDPRGLAHAVDCARDFVRDEPFLVYLGDNLLQTGLEEMVNDFQKSNSAASILLAPVEDPERFGVAEIEGGEVVDLVEKPDRPPSNLAIVGTYLFTEEIFPAIEEIEPSDRGELEITDAIARLIKEGRRVTPSEIEGWWLDVGRPGDAIEANDVLLRDTDLSIEGETVDTELRKRSEIGTDQGSVIRKSKISGPVRVAENSEVVNSKLGPNVSIGEDVVVEDSHVEDAIIMSGTEVVNTELSDALVGADATIEIPGDRVSATLGSQARIIKKE
ncbi:MAG: glucose-1-phosphate thymidylyltransferase [Candidatus Bipolaricaulota bacterium]